MMLSGFFPYLDFLWLSAHVSGLDKGQLEKSPWLKSFGTIQAASTVSCSGSFSCRDILSRRLVSLFGRLGA
jgi:hypothetical protein